MGLLQKDTLSGDTIEKAKMRDMTLLERDTIRKARMRDMTLLDRDTIRNSRMNFGHVPQKGSCPPLKTVDFA
jgi:hypothetical protein